MFLLLFGQKALTMSGKDMSRIEEDNDSSDNGFQNIKGKGIYYLCDLHSSQPSRGKRRYDRLARTYQVTFCSYTVFPEKPDFLNSFSLRHDKDNSLLSDAIHIMFVELSKLKETLEKPVADMSDLEKWDVFFRYANIPRYRDTVNEIIQSKEAMMMAGDILMSVSQDERERAVFRSRRMYQTDLQSNIATAEDRGRRLGKEEGRAEGRMEGKMEEKMEIARNLMEVGMPSEQIEKVTGLSAEALRQLHG